jgi:TatA/E family protein of Tat protein translocase
MIVLVIALLVFGPQKLPEIGRQIGGLMREFRRMSDDVRRTFDVDELTGYNRYDTPTSQQQSSYHPATDYNPDLTYQDDSIPARLDQQTFDNDFSNDTGAPTETAIVRSGGAAVYDSPSSSSAPRPWSVPQTELTETGTADDASAYNGQVASAVRTVDPPGPLQQLKEQ